MKFRVSRDEFVEAVSWVARNANSKGGITAGLLLETHNGSKVRMGATDEATTGKNLLGVEVLTEGKAVLPARRLSDFARTLPPGTVELNVEGAGATLTCGSVTFQLATLPVGEYPTLVKMPSASGTVPADVFAAAVAQVATAASKDEASLPVLTSVRIETDGDKLSLVATDRYRLAVRELPWSPADAESQAAVLVPRTALVEAAKSFASAGTVTVALAGEGDDALVGFSSAASAVITRQVGGEFPKYRALFPEEFSSKAVVSNDVLADSLKRAALVTTANSAARLTFNEKGILLEAGEPGSPDAMKEQIACTFEGEGFTIGFNPTYLAEGIGATGSEMVTISLNGPAKAAVVTGSPGFRYLLMPVRVNNS